MKAASAIIAFVILSLIGVIVYSYTEQLRMEREIEQLRIQIKEMQKPIPPELLDAKAPAKPKLEKSSYEFCPYL